MKSIPLKANDLDAVVNKNKRELSDLDKILQSEKIIKENVQNKIVFSKAILTLKDQPFIFPKTLNVIQGKSGSHKSRLAEHICSVLLKIPENQTDSLQLKASGKETAVCYVDTERNISEQFPYSLQQIIKHAGYQIQDEIENFNYISLIDVERSHRFAAFKSYLERIREDYQGHIFVVLDVLTDLVENFNDPKNSLQLIDLLNSTINSYDITFLCIIHENPFQEKARGHLGTELLNKSSTALSINFEIDKSGNDQPIIKIKFLKARTSKRIEPIYIKYSPDHNRLVYAEDIEIEQAIHSKVDKANIYDVASFLGENLKGKTTKTDLIKLLAQEFDCTGRTIENRINDMLKGTGLSALGYRLKKGKIGREIWFELKKIIPEIQQEDIF